MDYGTLIFSLTLTNSDTPIQTTHQQIGEARDKLQLKRFMQRWRKRIQDGIEREDDLVKEFNSLRLRSLFSAWQNKLRVKRQIAWRNDMRQRMKVVKNKADERILKTAWKQWRRIQLISAAEAHYHSTLLIRHVNKWKDNLIRLDNLDNTADEFAANLHSRSLESFWTRWKILTGLRHDERTMVQRVNARIMTNTFDRWRAQRQLCITVFNKFSFLMVSLD